MNQSDMPPRVAIPFGNNASGAYIRTVPVPSQIGVAAGAASFTDGFTPDTFTPLASGGAYVSGEDMNGILNHVTRWTRWQTAGGPAVFNSTFATQVGGYPRGAVLVSSANNGSQWMSTVDGNLTDPDGANASGWTNVGPLPATLAQMIAGTDNEHFITPALLSNLFKVVDAESWRLPGGLIIKLGTKALNGGGNTSTTALNFATPFPNSFGGIIGSPGRMARPDWAALTLMWTNFTASGGTIVADTTDRNQGMSSGIPAYWLAWGT